MSVERTVDESEADYRQESGERVRDKDRVGTEV